MAKTRTTPSPKLQATKNYSLFRNDPDNRVVELQYRRDLIASMKKYGWVPSYPMHCTRRNGKLCIHNGQHRFAIAQKLSLTVFYVVWESEAGIPELNNTQRTWKTRDYAMCFAAQGNAAYLELLEFCEQHRMSLTSGIALLAGQTIAHAQSSILDRFRNGRFAVNDRQMADRVAQLYVQLTRICPEIKTKNCLGALAAVIRIPNFDETRLIQGAARCPELLMKYATREAYLDMLERVYNYGRRRQDPLKIAAHNALRDRNPVNRKKAAKT